eukprot:1172165-Rhodomonas_salina.1
MRRETAYVSTGRRIAHTQYKILCQYHRAKTPTSDRSTESLCQYQTFLAPEATFRAASAFSWSQHTPMSGADIAQSMCPHRGELTSSFFFNAAAW